MSEEKPAAANPAPPAGSPLFKSVVLSALGLVLAAGSPIGLFAVRDYWNQWRSSASLAFGPGAPGAEGSTAEGSAAQTNPAEPVPAMPPLEGVNISDLSTVFRFDVTPGWVIQHWPRVSTGLADPRLEGYRVPLVTGTQPADLAGALTYYFDPEQKVQRITFRGTTGDVRKLARLLTERFGFTRRLTNDPGLVVYERVGEDGKQTGVARFRAADVIQADRPLQRFQVELAMERAG